MTTFTVVYKAGKKETLEGFTFDHAIARAGYSKKVKSKIKYYFDNNCPERKLAKDNNKRPRVIRVLN